MLKKIAPSAVLTIICIIVSALLIVVYNLTYVDTTGVITDELNKGLTELYGENEYTMLKNDDGTVLTFEGIQSVIKSRNNNIAFEVISDGYAKGGIHVLIGVSDNGVEGISFINLGETPSLGTKIRDDKNFVKQFLGIKSSEYEFSTITGATFSSKGLKSAVDTALKTYQEYKEDILK